ncbi:MAG: iron ABC transporter permease [Muribaculaceae bacterium]|nr:iron ABC transporter permease [Muribaculaceae bacterium]
MVACLTFGLIIVVLFPLLLVIGSVDIPLCDVWGALTGGEVTKETWRTIVVDTRIPAACTAAIAGAALSVAGLLLQTTFDNPLAGPSILGVSTGSSLGVAIVMLALGGAGSLAGQSAVLAGALIGAMLIMAVLVIMSSLVRSATMLLIVGILIGYISSSAISLLNFFATQEGVHSYVIWGLGNFYGVSSERLPWFALLALILLAYSLLFIKPLNALLLGTRYAENIGVRTVRVRNQLLLLSGALTALVTAACGPIGFIGLVVPHIARLSLGTSNHTVLLPATILAGAATGLLCALISVLPTRWGVMPINAITPIIGVPVIVYIILRRRKIFYFN